MKKFAVDTLRLLYRPRRDSSGEDNGQVAVIGGSRLFHGAPFFAIQAASRVVDMVFFASPEKTLGDVVANLKSRLFSFIWVPWVEVEDYIKKSDALLIGPGFMRARSEKANSKPDNQSDAAFKLSRKITKKLLSKYPNKKWVIDAGGLQVMEPAWIPPKAILTPNRKEYKMLFGDLNPYHVSKKYDCILVLKGPISCVYSKSECVEVHGGNPGMTKGGTGDVMAGLTVALLAKNEPFLAASAAAFITKAAAEALCQRQGFYYNADDLAEEVPKVFHKLINRKFMT